MLGGGALHRTNSERGSELRRIQEGFAPPERDTRRGKAAANRRTLKARNHEPPGAHDATGAAHPNEQTAKRPGQRPAGYRHSTSTRSPQPHVTIRRTTLSPSFTTSTEALPEPAECACGGAWGAGRELSHDTAARWARPVGGRSEGTEREGLPCKKDFMGLVSRRLARASR